MVDGIGMKAGGRYGTGWALALLLCAAALLLPALANRYPVLYPDSVGYFHSGFAAARQIKPFVDTHLRGRAPEAKPALTRAQSDSVSTARSVYYGLTFVAAYVLGGVWALALGQVLLTALCLVLAGWRVMGPDARAGPLVLAALVAMALLTGLGIFAVTAMPDLFAGLMLLGAAMVLAYGAQLSWWERVFWLAVVLIACLYHKSHILILGTLLVVLALARWTWSERAQSWLLLAMACALGLIGHFAVDLTVRQVAGRWPITPPFLLARFVGDGPAVEYLKRECPTHAFATCAFLGRMPMRENDFLWSHDPDKGVMGVAPTSVRSAIAAEANAIAWNTFVAYPGQVLAAAARNVVAEFSNPGVREYGLLPRDDIAPIHQFSWALDHYRQSLIAKGQMPLGAISRWMRAVYFAGLAGSLLLLWLGREKLRGDPAKYLAWILIGGLVANAAVLGAVSGVFDRYQGRVAWLAAFAFLALVRTLPLRTARGRVKKPGAA